MDSEVLDFLSVLRAKLASTTYDTRRYEITAYFKYLEKQNKHFLSVTPQDIAAYILSMVNANQTTRQRRWSIVRDFYDFLNLPVNPARAVPVHAARRWRLYRVPDVKTVERMLSNVKGINKALTLRNKLMVELAYGSGLRRCELHRLDIEDVDWQSRTMQVVGKGSIVRTVPVTATALDLLKKYLAERKVSRGPLIAKTNGRRPSLQAIGVLFKHYTGKGPHLLRHACATHMLRNGCDVRYIQELLGHTCLTTTQVYTHITKDQLQEVIDRKHPRAVGNSVPVTLFDTRNEAAPRWRPH